MGSEMCIRDSSMGQYLRVNMVWDPSQVQQNLQPNVQLPYYQPGKPIGYGPTQQPIQPNIQVSAPGPVQQPGPSTPRTLTQSVVATSVQATTPIPGVSAAPVSTTPQVSRQFPQVSVPQFGPIIQTTV